MQVYEPFHFNSWHWLLALAVALLVHTTFFLSYRSSKILTAENIGEKSIVIQLKKITRPPQVKQLPIQKPRIEPLPEDVVQPKPKLVTEPVAKPKPKVETLPKPAEIPEKNDVVEPIRADIVQTDSKRHATEEQADTNINLALKRNYEAQLLAWLEKHKKYPNIARRRGQQGTVILEFVMNADGNLLSHKIVQASKYAALNDAVVKMIKRSSPLPAIPKALRGYQTEYSYTIPINFTLK